MSCKSELHTYVPQQELWIPFHTAVVTFLTSLVRCLCLISRGILLCGLCLWVLVSGDVFGAAPVQIRIVGGCSDLYGGVVALYEYTYGYGCN